MSPESLQRGTWNFPREMAKCLEGHSIPPQVWDAQKMCRLVPKHHLPRQLPQEEMNSPVQLDLDKEIK